MDDGDPSERERRRGENRRGEQKLGPFPIRRNDSGFFSPSPITPHQGESRLPGTAAAATTSDRRGAADLRGVTTVEGATGIAALSMPVPRPLQTHTRTHTENTPALPPDDPLLLVFACRERHGHQQWLSCAHPHCETIREQWHHCSQPHPHSACPVCTHFQQLVSFHQSRCSDPHCYVLFCANHRRPVEQNPQSTPAPPTGRQVRRAHSFSTPTTNTRHQSSRQDTPSNGMRPRVGSTGAQSAEQKGGSYAATYYDSTSYIETLSDYTRAGIGYVPSSDLATNLGARVEEIVKKLEQEQSFEEDYRTPDSSQPSSRPTSLLAPQLSAVSSAGSIPQVSNIASERELGVLVPPLGVLSPIVEQPGSENSPSPSTSPGDTSLAGLAPQSSVEILSRTHTTERFQVPVQIGIRSFPLQERLTPFVQDHLMTGDDGHYYEHRDYFLNDVQPLGEGGFGTCVPGHDLSTKSVFALKRNKTSEEDKIESIRSECLVLSKLHCHDNVIRLLGAVLDEDDGLYPPRVCKMIMEFAENGNLAELLVDEEDGSPLPLPIDQSLYYLHQILSGVLYLHSNSVLHLDIKGLNILVFNNGRIVKLADFGSAVHVSEVPSLGIAKLKGCSPHFIAPEVAQQVQPSFSADIWSTMCVFVEMLTAKLPWCYFTSRMEFNSVMYMVGKYTDEQIEELVPISQLPLDEGVADLFYQVFRMDPTERPTALHLLSHPCLIDACDYEQYFFDYTEEEEEEQFEEEEEESFQTAPTSLPLSVEVPPPQQTCSSATPTSAVKRASQDSGVGSSVHTPASAEPYTRHFSHEMKSLLHRQESILETEDDPSPGRSLSYPPTRRSQDCQHGPNPSVLSIRLHQQQQQQQQQQQRLLDWQASDQSSGEYHSLPPSLADSGVDTPDHPAYHELFRSLSLGSGSTRPRPHPLGVHPQSAKRPNSFMHSSSAPMMGVDGHGRRRSLGYSYSFSEPSSGTFPQQGKLRRTSSEVYVDRGPDIDTPEEKKEGKATLGELTSLPPDPPTSLDPSEGSNSGASLPSQSHSLPSSHPSSYTSAVTGESTGSHGDEEKEGEGRSDRQGPTAASVEGTEKRQEGKKMFHDII